MQWRYARECYPFFLLLKKLPYSFLYIVMLSIFINKIILLLSKFMYTYYILRLLGFIFSGSFVLAWEKLSYKQYILKAFESCRRQFLILRLPGLTITLFYTPGALGKSLDCFRAFFIITCLKWKIAGFLPISVSFRSLKIQMFMCYSN